MQSFFKRAAVGSEILIHSQRNRRARPPTPGPPAPSVCRHSSVPRGHGVVDFIGLHGAKIEKQNDETPVFQRAVGDGLCYIGRLGLGRRQQRRLGRGRGQYGVCIFEIERNDLLRLIVFENGEVLTLEVAHRVAILVAHGHVDQHQLRGRAEGVIGRRFLRNHAGSRQQQCHNKGE